MSDQIEKPGGIFLIGTPNSNSLVNFTAEMCALLTNNLYYYPIFRFYGRGIEHLNIFNPHNLSILMKKHNLKVIKQYGYNIPLTNMCDVNFIYKNAIRLLTILPYEFVLIAEKGGKI